jgi:hypothetical protein
MVRARRFIRLTIANFLAVVMLLGATPLAIASAATQDDRSQLFSKAAKEFGVPENILKAVSYNESRWDSHGAQASADGGYGLMDLTTKVASEDGRGNPDLKGKQITQPKQYTLDEASQLLGVPADTLKKDDTQNVRGAAAVLAKYAKQTNHNKLPSNESDWYAAVAKYSGSSDSQTAQDFADSVYDTMQNGVSRETTDHQYMHIAKDSHAKPNKHLLGHLSFPRLVQTQENGTDCPSDIFCKFVQAGYAANSSDPADFGNYDPANRPKDMDVKYIVIHDTEGSYNSAINHFLDTSSYVSANYVVRSSDGAVTEMVRPSDVSWAAGNWYMNMHAINIEHEGFANDGAGWYTETMYKTSAKLVRYLAKRYNIPMDRQHIIGHDEVSQIAAGSVANSHWDPGAYWDWNHYMNLITGKIGDPQATGDSWLAKGKTITVDPNFDTNQPEITDCSTGTCQTLPKQGANFVYLHTQPSDGAPLLSNKYMHPDGSAGTTLHSDWSAKATNGEHFVVADTQGDWTGIWYGGEIGWFYNPNHQNSRPAMSQTAQTKGATAIPVYVTAYPEQSVYPIVVPGPNPSPLYDLPAGQSYAVIDANPPTDYFYDATINYSKPYDHKVFKGNEKYVEISFNHRVAFVKASDVMLQ